MAKFFNKKYAHAYERNGKVWVKGTIKGHPFHRMSTQKEFSKANMNWVEKHWESLLSEHFEKLETSYSREKIPTLDEYAEISFEMHMGSRKFYTTDKYRSVYRKHISPVFGHKKLDEITVRDIKLWYSKLPKLINAHEYASKVNSVLSGILVDAMEDELVDKNVTRSVRFPKKKFFKNEGEIEVDPFTLEEVYTLIDNASGFFKNVLIFQFFTGTRPGEMISLMWEDVDFSRKEIRICRTREREKNPDTNRHELGSTKTGKTRIIDILPPVEKALRDQYKITGLQSGFIFLSTEGEPYMKSEGLGKRQWRSLLKRCLFRYRNFYQTRHTFASIFLSKGEDLAWVSKKMLGHENIQTTLKYYARYIEQKDVKRGAFLDNERTQSVHEDIKKSESA